MIKIRIKNIELGYFIEFLHKLRLAGKASRMRTRLINQLTIKLQLFQEEHRQLLLEHCNLDDHGEPRIIEKDGVKQYDVKEELKAKFDGEYLELAYEEVVIDKIESNKEMLLSVKESVLNCDMEFEGQEAMLYDRWCEILEQISYEEEA